MLVVRKAVKRDSSSSPPPQVPYVDVTGDDILGTFGFSTSGWQAYWSDCLALAFMTGVLLLATFLLLQRSPR